MAISKYTLYKYVKVTGTWRYCKLLKKNEEPKYHKKKVIAHPDDELDVLYGAADGEETFLLDFFIGSMARDHEAYGKYGHPDLTGTTLTIYASDTRPAR